MVLLSSYKYSIIVNKNIWLSISMLLDELEVESDENKERILLLRKFNDLLISES